MTTHQQMQTLKAELDNLDRQQSESNGVTKQLHLQLKELGFDTVEEAITGVKSLNSERIKLEKTRDTKLAAYVSERDARLAAPGTE